MPHTCSHLNIIQACSPVSTPQPLIMGCCALETVWRLVALQMQMDLLLADPDTSKFSLQIKAKQGTVRLEWQANLSALCLLVGVGICLCLVLFFFFPWQILMLCYWCCAITHPPRQLKIISEIFSVKFPEYKRKSLYGGRWQVEHIVKEDKRSLPVADSLR